MEDIYKMSDIWKLKLKELEYQKAFMLIDKQFNDDEIHDINVIIDYVKKEYAKALIDEKKDIKEESENNKGSR